MSENTPSSVAIAIVALTSITLLFLDFHILHVVTNIETTSSRFKRPSERLYTKKEHPKIIPTIQTQTNNKELLPTYDLPPNLLSLPRKEPDHLTPINPKLLIPRNNHHIDTAHRKGLLHWGSCLFVMDATGKLLFLKRSQEVITCPNTWSILGEHSIVGENGLELVVRGLEEELGLVVDVNVQIEDETKFDNFQLGVEVGARAEEEQQQTRQSLSQSPAQKERIPVTIHNVTQFPLYYIRYYGPRNDNRVDRQMTYLWLIQLPKPQEEIHWVLDEEVADYKWVDLEELEDWLKRDEELSAAEDLLAREGGTSSEGVRDDGPTVGEFCHWTIRSLYRAGLEGLKQIIISNG